jgi:hypothetical protein
MNKLQRRSHTHTNIHTHTHTHKHTAHTHSIITFAHERIMRPTTELKQGMKPDLSSEYSHGVAMAY